VENDFGSTISIFLCDTEKQASHAVCAHCRDCLARCGSGSENAALKTHEPLLLS